VNGSELYATNQAITAAGTTVTNLGNSTASTLGGGATYNPTTGTLSGFSQPINSVSTTGAVGAATPQTTVAGALTALNTNVDNTANIAVKYDSVGGNTITLGATGGTGQTGTVKITNLTPATINNTSTDAVNGSQLYGTSQSVATNLGGGSTVNPDGTVSAPSYAVYGSTQTNVGAAITALQSNAPVQYSTAAAPTTGTTTPSNDVTLVGAAAGPVTVHNVAPGAVSATSTDAVNGSQLNTVSGGVNNLGNSTANNFGGGSTYDPTTGTVSAPSYTTYNPDGTTGTANNVGAALTAINTTGIKYFHAKSTGADSQALGTDSVAIGPSAVANNANDVALGANSTTAATVATASGTINGTSYNYAGSAPTSTLSVGSAGNERTITNVAAGRVGASSTDAVNGSQLYATNSAIDTLAQTTSEADRNNVKYDAPGGVTNYGSVTLAGPESTRRWRDRRH
jgi:autotransporter adhesin